MWKYGSIAFEVMRIFTMCVCMRRLLFLFVVIFIGRWLKNEIKCLSQHIAPNQLESRRLITQQQQHKPPIHCTMYKIKIVYSFIAENIFWNHCIQVGSSVWVTRLIWIDGWWREYITHMPSIIAKKISLLLLLLLSFDKTSDTLKSDMTCLFFLPSSIRIEIVIQESKRIRISSQFVHHNLLAPFFSPLNAIVSKLSDNVFTFGA